MKLNQSDPIDHAIQAISDYLNRSSIEQKYSAKFRLLRKAVETYDAYKMSQVSSNVLSVGARRKNNQLDLLFVKVLQAQLHVIERSYLQYQPEEMNAKKLNRAVRRLNRIIDYGMKYTGGVHCCKANDLFNKARDTVKNTQIKLSLLTSSSSMYISDDDEVDVLLRAKSSYSPADEVEVTIGELKDTSRASWNEIVNNLENVIREIKEALKTLEQEIKNVFTWASKTYKEFLNSQKKDEPQISIDSSYKNN